MKILLELDLEMLLQLRIMTQLSAWAVHKYTCILGTTLVQMNRGHGFVTRYRQITGWL